MSDKRKCNTIREKWYRFKLGERKYSNSGSSNTRLGEFLMELNPQFLLEVVSKQIERDKE